MPNKNLFTNLEYDPIKLLNSPQKIASIFEVRDGMRDYDPFFPISVELHLTDRCNLNCRWCTDAALRARNHASLGMDRIRTLFADLAQHGVGITIEGGGEPTTHPRFQEAVRLAQRHELDLGLITNGVIPMHRSARAFRWIRISIDASNAAEYVTEKGVPRFDAVMKNIESLAKVKQRDFLLGIGYVMTRRNTDQLLDFILRMNRIGVDNFYARPIEETPDLAPDFKMLYDIKSEWETRHADQSRIKVLLNLEDRVQKNNEGLPCIAHSLSCVIQANGDVVMCEKRRHDPVVFGNINSQRFPDIWASQYRKDVSRRLRDPENQKGCEVCRMTRFNRYFCRLGELRTRRFI